MRRILGFIALAAMAAQPSILSAAPAGAIQARQETIRLALLQGQGQRANQGGEQSSPPPGRVQRTTVLSRVLVFAPAAAVGGLLIAIAAGAFNGRGRAISR